MSDDPVILAIGADFTRIEAALVHTSGGGVIHREKAVMKPVSTGRLTLHKSGDAFQRYRTNGKAPHRTQTPRGAKNRRGVAYRPYARGCPRRGGRPQSEFILPEDERFAEAEKRLQFSAAEVYEQVGLTPERCKVPYAAAAAGGAKGGTKVLTPKDYLKWALTGEFSTDALDAQRTFVWDLDKREWSRELCNLFGIPIDSLPAVLEATAPAGRVTAAAARATGLREGLTVACGMGDWGEYLGSGVYEEGDAFEHIGTTGAFYGVTSRRPAAAAGLDVRPHIKPDLYLTGRQGLPGGASLEWFLRKTSLSADGVIDWVAVEQELEAAAAMAQPENVLFFPNLAGGEGQIRRRGLLEPADGRRPDEFRTGAHRGAISQPQGRLRRGARGSVGAEGRLHDRADRVQTLAQAHESQYLRSADILRTNRRRQRDGGGTGGCCGMRRARDA